MHRHLRHHATLLALCAVLLRGLIPLGWMPSTAAGGLALCTADGLVQLAPAAAGDLLEQAAPPAEDGHTLDAPCAFAASGPLGCAPLALALPDALPLAGLPDTPYSTPFLAPRTRSNVRARAPPLSLNESRLMP